MKKTLLLLLALATASLTMAQEEAHRYEIKSGIAHSETRLNDHVTPAVQYFDNFGDCETMIQRYDGYCQALAAHGLKIDERIIFNGHLPEMYSHHEVEKIIANFAFVPEAIVCANDDIALKCMRALMKKGLKCPNDIAVTGFDNEEALTQADPKLTTVSVHNQMLGK